MDARREYTPPAVAAEDVLEQTSLACNATMPWPGPTGPNCFAGELMQNFAPGLFCETDVSKGGAFIGDQVECQVVVPDAGAVVPLS